MRHTVTLPRDTSPVFPDRCVVCGIVRPAAAVTLMHTARVTGEARSFRLMGWTTRRIRYGVPTCVHCATDLRSRLARRRFIESVGCLALIGIGLTLMATLRNYGYNGRLRAYAAIAVFIAGASPYMFWRRKRDAVPFRHEVDEESVDYSFRDKVYAGEFAAMNGVSIDV